VKFEPTAEQADFARTLEQLLAGADTVGAARAWAEGNHEPGLALWRRLAEQGVHALVVDEDAGGMGASASELVIAFEALGRHAVPGPWVESVAYLPRAVSDPAVLESLAEGAVGTVVRNGFLLDADVAEHRYRPGGPTGPRAVAEDDLGELVRSVDPTRRLVPLVTDADTDAGEGLPTDDPALDLACLANAALLLGAGERILADSVEYVKQRRQFGRQIGSYQAIKHKLADVRIALDFVRPLVQGAALADGSADFPRDVSAACVAAADAAYLASRTGLQVHGAIGYTLEFDLSLWLTKVRAHVTAWGTPGAHRTRVLDALVEAAG